jgi:hypothetical protein
MGERRGAHRVMVERPQGKRLLERSRPRYVDNINANLKYIIWKGVTVDLFEVETGVRCL